MRKFSFIFFWVVISGFSFFSGKNINAVPKNLSTKANLMNLKSLLNEEIKPYTPGVQYIALNAKEVIFSYSDGYADIANKKPMTIQTTAPIFSMTKTFTAIAILQLAEKQKLNLGDPVINYLPYIPYGDLITIRQLITHSSGIPNPIPLKWVHLAAKHDSFREDEVLKKVLKENPKVKANPGEKYLYSNIGYWLLGKIVEKVTNLDFTSYVTDTIFKPLGLAENQISFIINDYDNFSKGYLNRYSLLNMIKIFIIDSEMYDEYEEGWLVFKPFYLNGPAFGGIISSSEAIAVFLQDLLKNESKLLNPSSKKKLFRQTKLLNNQLSEMTYGWHVGQNGDYPYFFKEGGGAGYNSEMRIYSQKKLATLIIINKTSVNTKKSLDMLDKHLIEVK